MRLKRLRISGFKTFADRVDVDLDGNLIAVVGPNGGGKSNMVDAILWGLGESSSRQLRATSGVDVIFAGSALRKPLGLAEVSLVFDNEDRSLPLDAAEVVVTRRTTRAGETTYEINRRPCRLRDVAELLADSGLGRAGYAVVGQREIDAALSASPEERRAWIDEAAGVQRYRLRRQEALRRLEAAARHLERVEDVLAEIEREREPLAREAERARRYRDLRERLQRIESGLIILELARATEELERYDAEIVARRREIATDEGSIAELEQRRRELEEDERRTEAEIEDRRARREKAVQQARDAAARAAVGRERLASFDRLEESLREEARTAQGRLAEARADRDALAAAVEASRSEVARQEAEIAAGGGTVAQLTRELEEIEVRLAEARARESERIRLIAEAAERARRREALSLEIEGIEAALPELGAAIEEARAAREKLEAAVKDRERQLEELEKRVSEEERAARSAERARQELMARLGSLEGRCRSLEALLSSGEGLAHGPRAVVEAAARGELEGEYVPVSSAVDVAPDLVTAIEIALGMAAHDLIVPDERAARRAIEFLKRERRGRATFQPVSLVRPPVRSRELTEVARARGVVGLASDLVRCRGEHRPVIESLLGRVVVVETLDDGLRLARTSGWSKIVTREGEVIFASGAIQGGVGGREPGAGLVRLRAQWREAEAALAAARREADELERRAREAQEKAEESRARAEESRRELEGFRAELHDARTWEAHLRNESSSSEKARERLRREIAALEEQPVVVPEPAPVESLEAARTEAIHRLASSSAVQEQAVRQLREAKERLAEQEARLADLERRIASGEEAERHRNRRRESLGDERERALRTIAEAEREEAEWRERIARLEAEREKGEEQRAALRREALEAARAMEGARDRMRAAQDALHQLEVARTRADLRRASAAQKLLEEHGLATDEALRLAPEVRLEPNAGAVAAALRRETRAMGEVNLGAIDAFARLEERYRDLEGQRQDILSGKSEIERGIRDLDRLTRERFSQTFERVREEFGRTFAFLFGGGEARLLLSEPDDTLESGIVIDVTLPGKRRQRLEALSGGERALAALAFLFALLRVKPSPLVVLDEVDAPLDGRNVERFVELLREQAKTTQILVVTHNPVTIEAAPLWFGVVMQEPGVSTLIPHRWPEDSLVERVVPAAYLKG